MALIETELYPALAIDEALPLAEMFAESPYHKPYDIPTNLLNSAHQVRPKEDFGDIKELARSIKELGVEQPIRVARWSLEAATEYLELNNKAYADREPMDPGELVACPDGETYLVVIYGHRRLAAARLAELDVVPTKVSDNPSFHDVLKIQTAENLHQRPKPFAFARGLKQVYELGLALGVYANKTEFAKHSGISVSETTKALRYCSLPAEIQQLVVDNELAYSKAVLAARLMESVMDNELLQMRIRREAEVDEQIESGKLDPSQRRQHIGLFDVDGDYLSERIKGVLGDAISHMARPKMSVRQCEQYVRKRINTEFKGVGSLISILDDGAHRRAMLEMHRAETRNRRADAFASLGAVVIATRLEANAPGEIKDEVQGPTTQRLLNKIAQSAGAIASTTSVVSTKEIAFDAKKSVQELVSAEEALLLDPDADAELEQKLASQKFQTATVKDKTEEAVSSQPKQTESIF